MNFSGNTEYNDGFSYENWGGYNLLVKLNQRNPDVQNYICDVIRFWVSEFDVDGIRLDAADVLDFDFMKQLRRTAPSAPDAGKAAQCLHRHLCRGRSQKRKERSLRQEISSPVAKLCKFRPA